LIFTVQLHGVRYTAKSSFRVVSYTAELSFRVYLAPPSCKKIQKTNFRNFESFKKVYQKNKKEQHGVRYTAEWPFSGVRYTAKLPFRSVSYIPELPFRSVSYTAGPTFWRIFLQILGKNLNRPRVPVPLMGPGGAI